MAALSLRRTFLPRGPTLVFLLVLMGAMQSGSDNVTTSLTLNTSPLATPVPSPVPSSLPPSSSSLSPSPSLSPLSTSFPDSQSLSTYSGIRISSSDSPIVEPTSSVYTLWTTEVIISSADSRIFPTSSPTSLLMTRSLASSVYITRSSNVLSSTSSSLSSLAPSSMPPSSTSLSFQISSSLGATPMTQPIPTTPSFILQSSSSTPFNSLSPTPTHIIAQPSSAPVNATPPYTQLTPTQSLSPTPTPTPTMEASTTWTRVPTAEPSELSLLEWFGIACGCAAVFFILFLVYHCHQVRQLNILRQKKEMKKEILHVDFSQGHHGDRVSSWRNSMALDAMTTHIELPKEDTGMDMQWRDNMGFEEVFLGDEPKAANNNSLLPQTNL